MISLFSRIPMGFQFLKARKTLLEQSIASLQSFRLICVKISDFDSVAVGRKAHHQYISEAFLLEGNGAGKYGLIWRLSETGEDIVSYITAALRSVDPLEEQCCKALGNLLASMVAFCQHPEVLHSLPKKGSVRVYPSEKKLFIEE